MNKPIRTISIFCLLLFLALMLNATYLQFWHADELNEDPRNPRVLEEAFTRERGAILVGRDPGRRERRRVDDQYEYQRIYPQPLKYAHITGCLSLFSQTGIEQSQNAVLSGEDDRLFVTRLIDLLRTSSQGRQRPAHDRPGGAGGGVRRARGPRRGRRGLGRRDRAQAPAGSWRWCRCPSYDPNELAAHDFGAVARRLRAAQDDRERAAAQPRDPDPAVARARRSSWSPPRRRSRAALRRRRAGARRRDLPAAAHRRRQRPDRQRGPRLRHRRDPVHPGDGPVVQHRVRQAGRRARRRHDARAGRGVRLQQRLPRRPRPAGRSRSSPSDGGRGRRPRSPASASSRCRRPRCRWRWSSAGIANGGTVMRPYLVDEVLHPRARGARQDRPRGALAGRRRRRPPTRSPT